MKILAFRHPADTATLPHITYELDAYDAFVFQCSSFFNESSYTLSVFSLQYFITVQGYFTSIWRWEDIYISTYAESNWSTISSYFMTDNRTYFRFRLTPHRFQSKPSNFPHSPVPVSYPVSLFSTTWPPTTCFSSFCSIGVGKKIKTCCTSLLTDAETSSEMLKACKP